MLKAALPALHWIQVGDEWSIGYGDAMQIWGLLVTVPDVKDAAWPLHGFDWVSSMINPAQCFSRCWAIVLPAMTAEDWAETSPFLFGGLLKRIVATRVPPSLHAQFGLHSGDFIALVPYYALSFPATPHIVADWSDWDDVHLSWMRGLQYERRSLADRNGGLGLLVFLTYFASPRGMIEDIVTTGDAFFPNMSVLTLWALDGVPASTRALYEHALHSMTTLPLVQLRRVAREMAALLMDLTRFPAQLMEYEVNVPVRSMLLHDILQCVDGRRENKSEAWLLDRYIEPVLHVALATVAFGHDSHGAAACTG